MAVFTVIGVVIKTGMTHNDFSPIQLGHRFVVVGHYDIRNYPCSDQRVYASKRNALNSARRWGVQFPYAEWHVEEVVK